MPPDLDPKGAFFAGFPLNPPLPSPPDLLPGAAEFLRFLDPADLHLTIAFFGPLDPERVDAVRKALASFPAQPPIPLRTAGLRLLPTPRRPSALAFEIDEAEDEISQRIESMRMSLYRAAGVEPDTRPALPHLTLARFPRKMSRPEWVAVLEWSDAVVIPVCTLELGAPCLFGRSLRHPHPRYVRFENGV